MLAEPKLKKTSATIIEIEPWYIITLNIFDVHREAKTTSLMVMSIIEDYYV